MSPLRLAAPLVAELRAAAHAAAGPRRTVARQRLLTARSIHSTPLRTATYRRFGQPIEQRPSSSQQPLNVQSLRDLLIQRSSSQGGGKGGGRGRGGGSSPRGSTLLYVALGGGGIYYVVHLEQVPETGRWRFIDVSRQQELVMGQDSYRQVLAEYRGKILPASHPHSRLVRKTAARIISTLDEHRGSDVSHGSVDQALRGGSSGGGEGGPFFGGSSAAQKQGGSDSTNWEVFVIDEPSEKNAFVLPGGKVFVFTGILPICANEDGLATVLGHEVAHQVARHSAEKASGYKLLMVGAIALEALLGIDSGMSRSALTLLMTLPNSRALETEADKLGIEIMSKACYDPREAARLWQRMQESEGGGAGGGFGDAAKALLSTHPVNSQRIRKMEEWLPHALETRSNSGCPNPNDVSSFRTAAVGRG